MASSQSGQNEPNPALIGYPMGKMVLSYALRPARKIFPNAGKGSWTSMPYTDNR